MAFPKKTVKVRSKKMAVASLEKFEISDYDKDFYKWTQKQAAFLKKRDFHHIDIDNLIEEIEALGKSDKRALRSYLVILLMHLLKSRHQSEKRSNSWQNSMRNARIQIRLILDDSPSLKRELPKLVNDAYEIARNEASEETGLPETTFPSDCPWKLEDIL